MFDHNGPASYVQLATGTPPTGGDPVVPQEGGLKGIQGMGVFGMSDDGQFVVNCFKVTDISWGLAWYVASTGAQVAANTNLSARKVTLFAIGY
jgi:hypothetical protein